MAQFWLVLANSSRARFFTGASPLAELREVHDMENETAKLREQDLVTDRQGRRHDDGYAQKSAMERDAMEPANAAFAREIIAYVEQARIEGRLGSLSIVAEPQILGKLRSEMSAALRNLVLEEVAKNVTDRGAEAVQDQLSVLH